MKVVLIDGNPNQNDSGFIHYVDDYERRLTANGEEVTRFTLRDMNIKFCIGCWDCWWKTPGVCSHKDDVEDILRSMVPANKIVYLSPLIMGYVSTLMKKLHDRSIPLLHPYIELVNGESHHRKRYDNYAQLGVVVQTEPDTDEEDLKIVRELYERFALNFRSSLNFFHVMQPEKLEKVIHETSAV